MNDTSKDTLFSLPTVFASTIAIIKSFQDMPHDIKNYDAVEVVALSCSLTFLAAALGSVPGFIAIDQTTNSTTFKKAAAFGLLFLGAGLAGHFGYNKGNSLGIDSARSSIEKRSDFHDNKKDLKSSSIIYNDKRNTVEIA